MKIITAFFMAWGNFLKIPCPVKRWDSKLNKLMLGFLPSVGAIVGIILLGAFYLAYWLGQYIQSEELRTLLVFMAPMLCCGFIHLDGFMDVNDAVLSRRDLEERQRILKDSSTGAFAVITVVVLMIAYFAAVKTVVSFGADVPAGAIFLIPIISRAVAGDDVLRRKKISVSQYAAGGESKGSIAMLIQVIIYVYIAAPVLSHSMWHIALWVVVIEALAALVFGGFARKQLGGMNGDIAGYEIVISECFGLIALGVLMSLGV